MDPLTQAVLGAAAGQMLYYRRLGRAGLLVAAAAAASPDLDVVYRTDEFSGWLYHRGITHSLFAPFVAGPLFGWLAWKGRGALDRLTGGDSSAGRLLDWIGLCIVAILTHPILDACTSYGTLLLAPFSDRRFAWDFIPVIDPLYSIPLALALLAGWWGFAARPAAAAALIATTLYMGFSAWLNVDAARAAEAQLAREGVRDARVHAYPTIFQTFLRRIVVFRPEEVRIGFYTALAPGPIAWQALRREDDPVLDRFDALPPVRLFRWFAMGQVAHRVEHNGDTVAVWIGDLRYGPPGPSDRGMWGVRAVFDDAGRLLEGPHRWSRRPEINAENLIRLWDVTTGAARP